MPMRHAYIINGITFSANAVDPVAVRAASAAKHNKHVDKVHADNVRKKLCCI